MLRVHEADDSLHLIRTSSTRILAANFIRGVEAWRARMRRTSSLTTRRLVGIEATCLFDVALDDSAMLALGEILTDQTARRHRPKVSATEALKLGDSLLLFGLDGTCALSIISVASSLGLIGDVGLHSLHRSAGRRRRCEKPGSSPQPADLVLGEHDARFRSCFFGILQSIADGVLTLGRRCYRTPASRTWQGRPENR